MPLLIRALAVDDGGWLAHPELSGVGRIPVPDGRLVSVQLRIAEGLLHLGR